MPPSWCASKQQKKQVDADNARLKTCHPQHAWRISTLPRAIAGVGACLQEEQEDTAGAGADAVRAETGAWGHH